jgi:hypothetical protein
MGISCQCLPDFGLIFHMAFRPLGGTGARSSKIGIHGTECDDYLDWAPIHRVLAMVGAFWQHRPTFGLGTHFT